jgi:TolB-like protein/tetratricopeptide (TPR) repeat protein
MSHTPTPDATKSADDRAPERLDSWKDIASYLKRDVSTVQRWERLESLPVHRHLHDKRGSVYAFRTEVDAWFLARLERRGQPAPVAQLGNAAGARSISWPAAAWVVAGCIGMVSLLATGILGGPTGSRSVPQTGSEPAPLITSLVVLPVANLTGDPAHDRLAAELTEDLTDRLAQIASLRVVSRRSAASLQGHWPSVAAAVRELGVDAALDGAVHREGRHVRVSLQLVGPTGDARRWAREVVAEPTDRPALYAEVARVVVEDVPLRMTAEDRLRLARRQSVNPAAYQEYLLGRHLMWKFIDNDRVRAMEHFSRAIELAPEYGAPYAGLAHAWWSHGVMGPLSMREVAAPARDAAEKALALDDRLAEAYAAKAYVQGVFDWDWAAAEATIRRGIAADPNNLETHYVYALLLMALGRLDQATAEIEEAARLDPLSAQVQSTFGRILWRAKRFDAAAERLHRAIELEPRHATSFWRLGDVYEVMGRYEEAIEAFTRAVALEGRSERAAPIARVYARMGRPHEARALSPEPRADVFVALGERDRAFEQLYLAIEQRNDWPIFIKRDPLYESLRDDPRWNGLLRRMNLPID